ncbi:MAG TPA: beta-ketoacyl synthase N-terminal-like domain-containing protein, partial [Pyrinomonadaceae bacterium]
MKRRVVVTGFGLVTPCGNDVASTWAAMTQGKSGADYIKKFDTEKFSVKFACEVKDFDPLNFLDKKEARRMGAFTHFAIAASDEAMRHSGLKVDDSNAEMIGTYISSGIGDFWAIEREHDKLLAGGPDRVSPFFIPQSIVNLAAGNVSIRHGLKGPNTATATACAAGAHAIGDSFRLIERG